MSDDDDDDGNGNGNGGNGNGGNGGPEQIVRVANQLMKSLSADSVNVELLNGSTVTGSIAGLLIKKKEKKGNVVWMGKITIETEEGSLQIDCENVGSINLR